jgi:hypothetical protein
MPILVTQTQNEVDVDDAMVVGMDDAIANSDMSQSDMYQCPNPTVPSLKAKAMVQTTLFDTLVKKVALKVCEVEVRGHHRRKSASTSIKKKQKVTCVQKSIAKSKRKSCKKSRLSKNFSQVIVNDPDLEETVKLMEKMKFDDMMELRERVFVNLSP